MAEVDPWDYYKTADDATRKKYILIMIGLFHGNITRGLDLGAGNGFISNDISNVEQVEVDEAVAKGLSNRVPEPSGKYDLILATGVLYDHYDYQQTRDWIKKHASEIVITSHYDKVGKAYDKFDFEQVFYAEFPYREGKQTLRVYRV